MDRRLQKLQTRTNVLRQLLGPGIPPDLTQVLTCEALVSELQEEHDVVARELKDAVSPAMKKLARDFAKLSPTVLDTLSKASQSCFDARFEIEARSRQSSTGSTNAQVPDNNELASHAQEKSDKIKLISGSNVGKIQTQMMEDKLTEDDTYSKEIEKELKQIELQAQSVRSLTENVAIMVAHQADDVSAVAKKTSHARDDVVAGLGELAEAKKKEAGKHTTRSTTVTAVIGGAVGLVGGPVGVALGAAAGAAVGAAIGSSIASLSRKSIDREVRAFKNKFKVDIRPDGSCVTYAEVYENERWSLAQKTWSSDFLLPTDYRPRWTLDELGTPLGPRDPGPMHPDMPPKSPEDRKPQGKSKAKASTPNLVQASALEEETTGTPMEDIMADDSSFSGAWRWAQNSKWMPDMSDKRADANGWQYAFGFGEGSVWYPTPSMTCFVRRRRWVRDQVLDPQKAHHPERIALIAMERIRNEVDLKVDPSTGPQTDTIDRATKNLGQSVQASRAILEELKQQGIEINEASIDVAIAEDASIHAQRVSRAVTMAGVFRNAFSSAPDATDKAILRRTKEDLNSQKVSADLTSKEPSKAIGWDHHPVDVLEKLTDEQLTLSKVIQAEVNSQNRQLDLLAEATARGERKILRARDMI